MNNFRAKLNEMTVGKGGMSFSKSYKMGHTWFDRFKKKHKEYEFHLMAESDITAIYIAKPLKHIATFNHKTGELFTDGDLKDFEA